MNDDPRLDEYERYLHEQLRALQDSYHEAARPIIDRLVRLNAIRQPRIFVPIDTVDGPITIPIEVSR